jgi:hypothetical protein
MSTKQKQALKKNKSKSKRYVTQLQAIHKSFFSKPKTMLMTAYETGIERAGICWYCRTLRKAGVIFLVKKGYCSVSKHMAGFYTTNPKLSPTSNQIKLEL